MASDNPHYPPERLAALAEARKATQYGGERPNPQAQDNPAYNKPHSIEKSLRYLAGQPIDLTKKDLMEHLPAKPTGAQIIAAQVITKAMKGDMRAVETCLERIDGKVVQPVQPLPPQQPYATDFTTPQEADAAYRDACKS